MYFIHKTLIVKVNKDKPVHCEHECDNICLAIGEFYNSRREAKKVITIMAKEFAKEGYTIFFGKKNRKFVAIKTYSNGMLLYMNYKVHSTNIIDRNSYDDDIIPY